MKQSLVNKRMKNSYFITPFEGNTSIQHTRQGKGGDEVQSSVALVPSLVVKIRIDICVFARL